MPKGATPDDAFSQIRLLMMINEVLLRNLIPSELARGARLLQSKPTTTFSPVAVTSDELGDAWRDAKLHLPLRPSWNGCLVGQPDAGADMMFNFAQLIACLPRTRNVRGRSIIGSGVVSSRDAAKEHASIAEQRSREIAEHEEVVTQFMRFGGTIQMPVVGAIEQKFVRLDQ
jgi:fumarylacetoacetate (FAA) hydrolase